jgi:hypothetical protein
VSFRHLMLEFIVQPLEPGRSVLVVQRDPMLHLFDVGRWMEIIRIEKDPIECLSDLHSDRRLSGTGYTHENDCLRMVRFHTGMNRLLSWGASQGDRIQNSEDNVKDSLVSCVDTDFVNLGESNLQE